MLSAFEPDADAAIGVLYTFRDPFDRADDGMAVVVSHGAPESSAVRGTLCGVISFPALATYEGPESSAGLLESITNYVQGSFYQSADRGLNALQSVMEGLHLYVQFLNDNTLQNHPIQGAVTMAEVKDSMIYVVYSDHTFNVVTKYTEGDTFPSQRMHESALIGCPGNAKFHRYQAELSKNGLFFLGTDVWYRYRDSVQAQTVLKQELVQAVAGAIDQNGKANIRPFEKRNPNKLKPGLLMGVLPPAETEAPKGKSTYVAPQERLETDTTEIEGTAGASFTAGRIGDLEIAQSPTIAGPEDRLELQSALDDFDSKEPGVPYFLRRAAGKTGNRLTRWFSEVFPDPQSEVNPFPAEVPLSPKEDPKPPVTPIVNRISVEDGSSLAAPAVEADPNSLNEVLRTVRERYKTNLDRKNVQSGEKSGSWAGMTLLLLLIVVPLATWIAYSVREVPASSNASNVADLTQQQLDAARTYLLQGQLESAQQVLQSTRNLIQTQLDQGGLTPRSKVLQHELDALWMEAFRIVPLVGLTEPLLAFGREEEPAKVVVNIQNLYLLKEDRGSQVVKHRLDLIGSGDPNHKQVILREGDLVEGVHVGHIVDIAFQPDKTAHSDKPSLYLLDDQLHIFQYNDTDHVSVVDLGQELTWKRPLLIDFYSNRMYVLDAGAGQIWRYNLNSTNVQQETWLSESTNLSSAIRMRVDEQIWLLLDNNSIVVYGSDGDPLNPANIQKPFALQSAIALESQFVDLETGTNQSNYLLLPDPGQQSILVLDKQTGDYIYQLAAPEGAGGDFDQLRDVYVHRDQIYILTSKSLYQHSFAP